MTSKLRLAVLVSGGGTNLQALIDRAAEGSLQAEVVVVASDKADAQGLVRAERAAIPTLVVDYGTHQDRWRTLRETVNLPVDLEKLDSIQKIIRTEGGERRLNRLAGLVLAEDDLIRRLDVYQPDYIVLAGFMRLFSPYFLKHYNQGGQWRVINIHPAFLPAFPGQHGYEETYHYGVRWGGITVHFADEGEDTGPIVAQAVYPIWPDDDLEAIRKRGLSLEHEMYAQCINWLAQGCIRMGDKKEKGRLRVTITDPAYPEILKRWTLSCFS